MKDDFLIHLLKTFCVVIGLMLLIYVLIATSSDKPTMLTLVYYNWMNSVFAFLWWLIKIVLVVGVLGKGAFKYYQRRKEKQAELKAKELKLQKELIREEEERIERERLKVKAEENAKGAKLAELKEQQLLLEKDRYIKNRSAEEANNDALKHFL